MEIEYLIDEFLLTIQAHGNVNSPGTVEYNRRRITFFLDFIRNKQIADPLTPHAFRLYAAHIKTRPRNDGRPGRLSVYYVHGCLQTLKRFGQWLHDEGHTTGRNLADVVSLPRLPHYRPNKSISKSDLAKMIETCTQPRDRALLLVLRDTGCRSCELLGMRWGDLDLDARHVVVKGKRSKIRWVFFVEETAEVIRAYRDHVPHDDGDPVWWGNIGRSNQTPLRYRGFYGRPGSNFYRLNCRPVGRAAHVCLISGRNFGQTHEEVNYVPHPEKGPCNLYPPTPGHPALSS